MRSWRRSDVPLAEAAGARLNVGSGPVVAPGWISIDGSWQARFAGRPMAARVVSLLTGRQVGHWPAGIRCLDVRRGLPFTENSASVVYSSHMIEHLFRAEAGAFLREARRVLAPGGICRIVVPDMRSMVQWYVKLNGAAPSDGAAPGSDRLMEMLGMSSPSAPPRSILGVYRRLTDFERHKWMYDEPGLTALFRESGFACPRARRSFDSEIAPDVLAAVERPERLDGGAGICVEARK
jgi:predicted SAM-dependent methyltransferase